jgi:hypothetical protein
MGYSLDLDSEKRTARFEATGVFTQVEALQVVRDFIDHPGFGAGYSVLADLTSVEEVPISGADVRANVDLEKSLADRIGKARFAIVAQREYIFGLARMYQAMMEDSSIDIRTFREIDQARSWLEEAAR